MSRTLYATTGYGGGGGEICQVENMIRNTNKPFIVISYPPNETGLGKDKQYTYLDQIQSYECNFKNGERLTFSIRSPNGKVTTLTGTYPKNSFRYTFSFDDPIGDYNIEIKTSQTTFSERVKLVKTSGPTFRAVEFAPNSLGQRKLIASNFEANEKIQIYVFKRIRPSDPIEFKFIGWADFQTNANGYLSINVDSVWTKDYTFIAIGEKSGQLIAPEQRQLGNFEQIFGMIYILDRANFNLKIPEAINNLKLKYKSDIKPCFQDWVNNSLGIVLEPTGLMVKDEELSKKLIKIVGKPNDLFYILKQDWGWMSLRLNDKGEAFVNYDPKEYMEFIGEQSGYFQCEFKFEPAE
jgi:hypothetical protein